MFINCEIVISLFSMYAIVPFIISPKLCGGILVAIPTAIPPAPLTKMFGTGMVKLLVLSQFHHNYFYKRQCFFLNPQSKIVLFFLT